MLYSGSIISEDYFKVSARGGGGVNGKKDLYVFRHEAELQLFHQPTSLYVQCHSLKKHTLSVFGSNFPQSKVPSSYFLQLGRRLLKLNLFHSV